MDSDEILELVEEGVIEPEQIEDFENLDRDILEPLLAIELNGESHNVLKKKLQDEDVKRHFDEAGLPILIFYNHQSLTVQELKTSIDLKLK